jgi:hypothetical protein
LAWEAHPNPLRQQWFLQDVSTGGLYAAPLAFLVFAFYLLPFSFAPAQGFLQNAFTGGLTPRRSPS